jgi:hypothetical protein
MVTPPKTFGVAVPASVANHVSRRGGTISTKKLSVVRYLFSVKGVRLAKNWGLAQERRVEWQRVAIDVTGKEVLLQNAKGAWERDEESADGNHFVKSRTGRWQRRTRLNTRTDASVSTAMWRRAASTETWARS